MSRYKTIPHKANLTTLYGVALIGGAIQYKKAN